MNHAGEREMLKWKDILHFSFLPLSSLGIGRLKASSMDRSCSRVSSMISTCCTVGGVPVLLSPGIHSFPFKLGLPLGLPSTFLGKHGWVQYYCKTALKEAHTGLAHKNQQVFIVMNPIDLNQEPSILAVSREFCVFFSQCNDSI